MSDPPAIAATVKPSVAGLFTGFLSIGVFGFGGVLPWARRMAVEQRRWLTPSEFAELLGLCQFLPGGNILNLTIAVGARFHGPAGALVSLVGLMAAPMAIVIGLGAIYGRYGQEAVVRHGFAGLAAAASALVLTTALKIAAPLRHQPIGIAVATLTFAAIAVLRLPLPLVLAVVAPLSVLLVWRRRA